MLMLGIIAAAIMADASPNPSSTVVPAAISSALPDGTYTYDFKQGANVLGSAIIAVSRTPSSIRTHESVTLGNTFTIDQVLDPTSFIPQRLDAVYPGAKPTPIHVVFSP